jgi:hypothetical protein
MSRFSSKWLNYLFKVFMAAAMCALLAYEFRQQQHLEEIWAAFKLQLQQANGWWLAGVVLLSPINWLAETLKWQPFVARVQDFSLRRGYAAVLAGISFSLFTPNRVGEFGGRILFVKPEHRWKAAIINFVGNLSQYLALLSGGILGAWYLLARIPDIDTGLVYIALSAIMVALGFMYYFYFNISVLIPIAKRIYLLRKLKKYVKDVRILEQFSREDLRKILFRALLRYAVYVLQYWMIARFFAIDIGFINSIAVVTTLYFIQTGIPLPAIAGLAARGGLAVYFWGLWGANEISCLAASFSLWIINLILPALCGTFFIFYVNITKAVGYDNETDVSP